VDTSAAAAPVGGPKQPVLQKVFVALTKGEANRDAQVGK
jgi:hypothetical protein